MGRYICSLAAVVSVGKTKGRSSSHRPPGPLDNFFKDGRHSCEFAYWARASSA
ncbi:hypothetical protein DM56_3121 [Burkholderia mallei]|nr:hypothetical protein DO70_5051 [Burkholderia pseudomallei]KOS92038.1 hypothetical protein DM45_2684 [Burkholderia mallei]KGD23821.1 hypothetical protein DP42_4814 [Burkholderia pseudomallei]KGD42872.1 hypothetical protein DO72_5485 [Burkholderia pseudomallei]KOT00318.1 hypothetical protein DM50_2480 [Burkholderia mallei]